jgi:hypothetical protein
MARKKSSRFITNKFTSNLKIFALLLMMRNITLVVKFDIVPQFSFQDKCKCGALVEYQIGISEGPGSSPACDDKFSAGMVRQT